MNKRGEEDTLWTIVVFITILLVFVALVYKINDLSSGRLTKAQVDSKFSSLLIDSSKKGTSLTLNKTISVFNGKVTAEFDKTKFEYEFSNPNEVLAFQKDGKTEVRIG